MTTEKTLAEVGACQELKTAACRFTKAETLVTADSMKAAT